MPWGHRGGGHGEAELLRSCSRASLDIAGSKGMKSVAFPAISCGVYGYPVEEAASVSIGAVSEWIEESGAAIAIRFVLFSDEIYSSFSKELAQNENNKK